MGTNTTPQKHRTRRILLPLAAGVLFVTLFLLVSARAANFHTIAAPLAAFAPYDPATYGIPYQIGDYNILAVKTSANTACLRPGRMRITVQAAQPNVKSLLASNGDTVRDTLEQLPSLSDVDFDLEFISFAPWNPAQFMSSNAEWNDIMKYGCFKLGGPIPTPTPDPFAPYAPATFGLPEIVAGYRIVAVHSPDNTPCMGLNSIRLTIQAVDPSPDNPMVARDGGDIIFEVKKLQPNIDWQLEYIMPQPVDQAGRDRFVASMEAWNKAGCVKLGGPQFTLTPDTRP